MMFFLERVLVCEGDRFWEKLKALTSFWIVLAHLWLIEKWQTDRSQSSKSYRQGKLAHSTPSFWCGGRAGSMPFKPFASRTLMKNPSWSKFWVILLPWNGPGLDWVGFCSEQFTGQQWAGDLGVWLSLPHKCVCIAIFLTIILLLFFRHWVNSLRGHWFIQRFIVWSY